MQLPDLALRLLPLLRCRLHDVFIVQGSVHDSRALMAANAEHAAVEVLLQPWCSRTPGSGSSSSSADDSAASSADLDDARIVAAANTLSSINPNAQVVLPPVALFGWGAAAHCLRLSGSWHIHAFVLLLCTSAMLMQGKLAPRRRAELKG
jgi:hypothetical protein